MPFSPTDGQCQAQLRTLKEQRSKLREFLLREREHEVKLTASRLESARAEVIAEDKAAEVEHLLDNQVLRAERVFNLLIPRLLVWYSLLFMMLALRLLQLVVTVREISHRWS